MSCLKWFDCYIWFLDRVLSSSTKKQWRGPGWAPNTNVYFTSLHKVLVCLIFTQQPEINRRCLSLLELWAALQAPLGNMCLLEGDNSSLHKAQDMDRWSEKSAGTSRSDTVQVTVDLIGVKQQQHVHRAWSYVLEWDLMKIRRQAWFASRKIHFWDYYFGAQNLSGRQRMNHRLKQSYEEYRIISRIPLWDLCTQFHCVSILRYINCWGSPAQDLYLNNAEQVMNTGLISLLIWQ